MKCILPGENGEALVRGRAEAVEESWLGENGLTPVFHDQRLMGKPANDGGYRLHPHPRYFAERVSEASHEHFTQHGFMA